MWWRWELIILVEVFRKRPLFSIKSTMKYIVFGYKRHGKDTACEFLRDELGMTFASSSWTACDLFLFDHIKGQYSYQSKEQCFEDRHNHRKLWFDAIRAYNNEDLARLARHIFANNDIYCGIRNHEEFYAMKEQGLFDLAIWIDAGDRLPPESAESMTLSASDADLVIDNNGPVEQMYEALREVMGAHAWGDRAKHSKVLSAA